MSKLPADCLNEIFEHLEDDEITLRSCLLVNRLWCKISVRVLWRSIKNYDMLIACLSDESKEILSENGINTSTSASKPPMFNYASFCKVLSVDDVKHRINREVLKNRPPHKPHISTQEILTDYSSFCKFLFGDVKDEIDLEVQENQQYVSPQSSNDKLYIATQEILKLLMSQMSSLRKLDFYEALNVPKFTSFPGARNCFIDLSELCCVSDIYSEFFCMLSQVCHNIQSLNISFDSVVSNGLADLISAQRNLKYLSVTKSQDCKDDLTPLLTNLPNTLIRLSIYGKECYMPFSFIAKYTHVQEITLSFDYPDFFDDFEELQHVTFPQLQVLKFEFSSPRRELLIKFLENNGKNLKEFDFHDFHEYNPSLSLNMILEFCPNLKTIYAEINKEHELETLRTIFNSLQHLEKIKIWCNNRHLNEKKLLDIVAKYSPKHFYKLKLNYAIGMRSKLLPEELESFFISWKNRSSQRSLSLIIRNGLDNNDENMKIIEKYKKLGIIKEFQVKV